MFLVGYSQDTIITSQGDTIECKITRVTHEFIHFTVFDKNGIVLMRSRLPLSGVQYYHQAEEKQEEVPQPAQTTDQFVLQGYPSPHFRLAINTGFTYQFGGYDGFPDSYKEQLQTLWNVGGELHYFLAENLGIGIKYLHSFTDANDDLETTNGMILRIRNERVRFSYVGLSVMNRQNITDDQSFNYFLAGGLLNYRSDLEINSQPNFEKGNTFAVAFGVVYDFRFSELFGVGLGAELLIANLTKLNVNGNARDTDFPVSRIELTAGLRIFN